MVAEIKNFSFFLPYIKPPLPRPISLKEQIEHVENWRFMFTLHFSPEICSARNQRELPHCIWNSGMYNMHTSRRSHFSDD